MDSDLLEELISILDDQVHRYCVKLSLDPGNEELIAEYEGFERQKFEVLHVINN